MDLVGLENDWVIFFPFSPEANFSENENKTKKKWKKNDVTREPKTKKKRLPKTKRKRFSENGKKTMDENEKKTMRKGWQPRGWKWQGSAKTMRKRYENDTKTMRKR